MTRELCEKLKNRISLANLPFVELAAGLVKPVTYTEGSYDNENARQTVCTIPVAWETNIQETHCAEPETALVPDSSKRGILYFEDGGVSALGSAPRNATEYQATVTLVSWYNRALITGGDHDLVQTNFIQLIRKALGVNFQVFNAYPFTRVMVFIDRILPQDGSVFAKYSYRETDRQYLMPPFEYFALQLRIRFTVGDGCFADLTINPQNC